LASLGWGGEAAPPPARPDRPTPRRAQARAGSQGNSGAASGAGPARCGGGKGRGGRIRTGTGARAGPRAGPLRDTPARPGRDAAALTAGHLLVGDEGIGDRLLHRLHDGGEERIHGAPGDEREPVVWLAGAVARSRVVRADSARVGGGERDEKVAGVVGARG